MHRNRNRIVTTEKSQPILPRKNRCVQFDRVNESQTLTANHRRKTLGPGINALFRHCLLQYIPKGPCRSFTTVVAFCNHRSREAKSVHYHERKSFGELFWPQRKTLQVGGGYKNRMKSRKTTSTTEIFPLWPPFFSAKKTSALEQGGVCFLFPSRSELL